MSECEQRSTKHGSSVGHHVCQRGHTLRTRYLICLLCIVSVLAIASQSYADNLTSARELRKAGKYTQAVELLNKEISTNPSNAEAHIELGACYINMGNVSRAEGRFATAMKLSPLYADEISEIYKKAGFDFVDRERADEATKLFEKALAYRRDIKPAVVSALMDKGKAFVPKKQYNEAEVRFSVALSLDQSGKSEICELFAELGDAADERNCLAFYQRAANYCGLNEKIGTRLLSIAKKLARRPGAEKDTAVYREDASRFLGEAVVQAKFPEVVVYQPGSYYFTLKAGEQTDHWIMFSTDEEVRFAISSGKEGSLFKRVYDDGDIVLQNEKRDNVRGKFKIEAVKDSVVKLIVR